MLEITVKGQPVEAKFNFRALFRANKLYSSAEGANDGASSIWLAFVTDDDMALFKALRVLLPKSYTNDDIMDALDKAEEDGKSQELFKEVEQELHESGFFKHAATRWLNLTEKYGKALTDKKNKTAEEKMQEAVTQDTLDAMKKSLS
ncbi:tail assembly chaperone [Lacticaseibacillus paracasei]|uniref:tail assembly chaperone n=1 Tax=Lacticaseibacillus paracasei TaxID=1597 RepID=UPI002F26D617